MNNTVREKLVVWLVGMLPSHSSSASVRYKKGEFCPRPVQIFD